LDRVSSAWTLAFAYVVYAAVGDIPGVSNYPGFSLVDTALVFVVLYLVHSYATLGPRTATLFLVVSSVIGYSLEYLFISTGWVGTYVYTADLSPFLGPIPAAIPLLWASLGYFCMLAADNYGVAALLMMLLDISFDPKFSTILWRWTSPGQYFGVPIANFAGWFVTALTIYLVFYAITRRRARSSTRAIAFYLSVGIFVGAIPDLVPGLYGAGVISAALFAVASLLIYLNARRRSEGARPAEGPPPTVGSQGSPQQALEREESPRRAPLAEILKHEVSEGTKSSVLL
jgi:uncharacterized membrane protein